jgi:hypothetical protein
MTVLTEASFPNSRVLADWWRELESFRPRSLWIARVVLHRVEGLVRSTRPVSLGRVETLLLRFLHSSGAENASPQWERLSVDPALLMRIAQGLAAEGLAARHGDGTWKVTPEGLQALAVGKRDLIRDERQTFAFLATADYESGHFIRLLTDPPAFAAAAHANPRFDPNRYHSCFTQSAEWKKRFGFPESVHAVLPVQAPESDWQSLVVDHVANVALVLVRTREGAGDGGLLGFWTEPGEWLLRSAGPAFRLAEGWREVFPALVSGPPTENWRGVWEAWCQARGLPATDAERCTLSIEDCHLVVRAPRRLLERLQALRSDALKGEAWLVAGDGSLRRAALLDVAETGVEGRALGRQSRG